MATTVEDEKHIARCVRDLLHARNEGAAIVALRTLFVEELDFENRTGTIALHGPELPASAARIAERDGVQVVAVRLTARGRVLVRDIRSALKSVQSTLNGNILLVAGDAEGGEWQLVYPSTEGGKDILRRIVLHRGQPHRTVVEQLSKVYKQARHGDLRAALESIYDVEAVTKKFFERYRAVFDRATELVTGLGDEQRRIFVQTLFNRLMFIYFVQRKGWLTFNGNPDYLNALWNDAAARDENLYDARLKSLFFVGLNTPQGFDLDQTRQILRSQIGDVPFLNGGLFSETDLDRVPGVHVPNEAIGPLLKEVFGGFNFTIAESTPYDIQVAVDPEMLGKVFEELVTGRHETGSYYTPRPIVSFMCREALKGYLQREVPDLPAETVGRYVDEDDVTGITTQQAGRLLHALEEITVVDPACGSGAYLLGMMQELLEAENALYNPKLVSDARSQYEMKLRIIQHNVYGVDIDPVAVNIAMLRLWLSLIVEYEGAGAPPPLPNLDFKIVLGDSISGPDPSVPPSTLMEDAVQRTASELRELKELYTVAPGDEKTALHRQVDAQQRALADLMAHTDVPDGGVHWRVQFAEVFERGGFDVVLANPPYVRQELIKEQKPRLKTVYGPLYSGTADLYVYFYYRALQLLGKGGMLVFISSNKWFRTAYGAKLRDLVASQTAIWSITDFGDLPVFESATAYPMIFVAQQRGARRPVRYTEVASLAPPYPDVPSLIQRDGFELSDGAIHGAGWRLTRADTIAVLDRMRIGTTPLGEYVGGRIYYGVKTGFNRAFVIDGATRDALIAADPKSAEIIKPFVVGKDVRRWSVDSKDRWLIVTKIGTDMQRYPAVFDHLKQWQPELEKRWDKGEHWWELRACAYYDAFEVPKIVYPVIANSANFAYDNSGAYGNDKVFILAVEDHFLLGVLNSASGWSWLRARCSPLQNGYREFRAIYLQHFPVPLPGPADRSSVEQLVEKCLALHGQELEVAELEAEINARVARLYGLLEEGDSLSAAVAAGAGLR